MKKGCAMMHLAILLLLLSGCSSADATMSDTADSFMEYTVENMSENYEKAENNAMKKEENDMKQENIIAFLMNILGCGERTAASMERELIDAGIPAIAEIQPIEDDVYTILEIKDDASRVYYAFIGSGYFLEEIRIDSMDGKMFYYAMQ